MTDTSAAPFGGSEIRSKNDMPYLVAGLACHSGINVPYELGCEAYDVDRDGDVDTLDLLTRSE